jgi:bifunctional DNase/RNase
MMEAEIWTIARASEGNTVLLKLINTEIGIPVFIDQWETRSILVGYGEKITTRPFIHDVFLELIQRLGLALFRIEIHDIRNNIFQARLLFSGKIYDEKKPLVLNGRPGDVFALAIRSKCPIYVSRKVAGQVGVPVEMFRDGFEEKEAPWTSMNASLYARDMEQRKTPGEYQGLRAELNDAIAMEAYERAVDIQDILLLLEKEQGEESLNIDKNSKKDVIAK